MRGVSRRLVARCCKTHLNLRRVAPPCTAQQGGGAPGPPDSRLTPAVTRFTANNPTDAQPIHPRPRPAYVRARSRAVRCAQSAAAK